MTTLARDSRSACTRNSSLLATFTAAVTAPIRAAPNQKYTHSGHVAVNNATVSPRPTPMSTNAFAAAHDRSRICSNVTGVPAIDISNRSGYCSAPRSSTAESAIEDLQSELRKRFLKVLRIDEQRGQRLVPLREMLQNLQT